MLPEMRAAADKLIFDCANVRYLADCVGNARLDRRVENLGWSVRQLFGHLALSLEWSAEALPKLLNADSSEPRAVDWNARNAEMARKSEEMPLSEILETMARARDRLIAQLLSLDKTALARQVTPEATLGDVIESWLPHMEEHALDLLDTEPALRRDPMALNWAIYAEFPGRPDLEQRQDRLVEEVRKWIDESEEETDEP